MKTKARIFQPAKTATQSGRAAAGHWVLEFEPAAALRIDPLMGWTGSADPGRQVRIEFDSKEAALAFAARSGLDVEVAAPHRRRIRPKAYAENFLPGRPR